MKRYSVFLFLLLFTVSLNSFGGNSCAISKFYVQTDVPISSITYNQPFNIDVVISYDGSIAADKLLVEIQFPANLYTSDIVPSVSNPITAGQITISGNTMAIPLTNFTTAGFTLHILNLYLKANTQCPPTSFDFTAKMKSSMQGTINPLAETAPSTKSISGSQTLGNIQILLPAYGYTNAQNNNSPFYLDFIFYVYPGTYTSNQMLISLSGMQQPVKKVVQLFANSSSQTLTLNADQKYTTALHSISVPKSPGFESVAIRIYFDANNTSFSLNTTVTASFDIPCGTIPGNSFSNTFTMPQQVTYKNDDALLQYPSIFGTSRNYTTIDMNYTVETLSIQPCSSPSMNFYLDNIYNQPLTGPIVTTFDDLQHVTIKRLIFDLEMLPQVSVQRGSGTYEAVTYDQTGSNVITLSDPGSITAIRMEYASVLSKISSVQMQYSSSAQSASLSYNLFKSGQLYMSFVKNISTDMQNNYARFLPSTNTVNPNTLGIGDPAKNIFNIYVYQSLTSADYIEYTLNPAMVFSGNLNLEVSLDDNTWMSVDAFNDLYVPSGNPKLQVVPISTTQLKIINIPLKGYYFACNGVDAPLYFRLNTVVVDRPLTKDNNINTVRFVSGNQTSIANYVYDIDVTENAEPRVDLSCDNSTYSNNLIIKSGDAFSIRYILENKVPYSYSAATPTFYLNLIQPGVTPAIALSQINGISSAVSSIGSSAYTLYYATTDDFTTCATNNSFCMDLVYSTTKTPASNVMKVVLNPLPVDYYDQFVMKMSYPSGLTAFNSANVQLTTTIGQVKSNWVNKSAIAVGPKSDCDLFDCAECITTFSPVPGKKYLLSAWVKEIYTGNAPVSYTHSAIRISYNDGELAGPPLFRPAGAVVDGWQRIEYAFTVPTGANNIHITLINEATATDAKVYFDDIRIHPFNSNMKSFVYDPSTQKLTAELDENNFATQYEYDDEGILIRVKKETERGVMTIKETRSNQSKVQTNKILNSEQ